MDQKNKTEIDFEIFDCEVDRGHELLILSYQEKRKQKFKMFYLITKSVEIHFGSYLVLGHLDTGCSANFNTLLLSCSLAGQHASASASISN